jgi:PAS domain S-box-containing protein
LVNVNIDPLYDQEGRLAGAINVFSDVTDSRRTEAAVRVSEERLRLALSAARMGTWTWDVAEDAHHRDANLNALFGLQVEETILPFADFLDHIYADDRGAVRAAFDQALAQGRPLNAEFRVVRPDGELVWLRDQGAVFGTAARRRMTGASVDVTDLKVAEAALRRAGDELESRVAMRTSELTLVLDSLKTEMARRRGIARRLGTAQEDERRRVSRDLHDTIGQLMAGLSLSFKAIETSGQLPPVTAVTLAEARRVASTLAKEVHGLAVRLRPTALDDIGLEAALEQLVADWSSQTGVFAEFKSASRGSGRLAPEIETAVYRVVQEALANVAKHSGASLVCVVVYRPDGYVAALIEDNGTGFDAKAVPNERLGLVAMQERLAEVGGKLEFESEPGLGTTVCVSIPLPP